MHPLPGTPPGRRDPHRLRGTTAFDVVAVAVRCCWRRPTNDGARVMTTRPRLAVSESQPGVLVRLSTESRGVPELHPRRGQRRRGERIAHGEISLRRHRWRGLRRQRGSLLHVWNALPPGRDHRPAVPPRHRHEEGLASGVVGVVGRSGRVPRNTAHVSPGRRRHEVGVAGGGDGLGTRFGSSWRCVRIGLPGHGVNGPRTLSAPKTTSECWSPVPPSAAIM